MNYSTPLVAGGSGALTSMIAGALMYFTHWPLQALTEDQALNLAGLGMAVIGILTHSATSGKTPDPTTTTQTQGTNP